MVRRMVAVIFVLFAAVVVAQTVPPPATGALQLLWTTSTEIKNPESCHFVAGRGIYVSNVFGSFVAEDNTGWVNHLGAGGRLIKGKWSEHLDAPKGVASFNNMLVVADLGQVLMLDIETGVIKQRVKVPAAQFLNDVAVGPDGTVYVSDTVGVKIFEIKNGEAGVFVEGQGMDGPNGLLIRDGRMFVAGWGQGVTSELRTTKPGRLFEIDMSTRQIRYITPQPLGHLDGLVIDSQGNFIVSDFKAGSIYLVTPDGRTQRMIDHLLAPADIDLMPDSNTLLVPEFHGSRVSAYKLAYGAIN